MPSNLKAAEVCFVCHINELQAKQDSIFAFLANPKTGN
jgi:hypothetical protein